MSRVSRGLAGLAIILNGALAGGCLTASHNRDDFHRVPSRVASDMNNATNYFDVTKAQFPTPARSADYQSALRASKTYGNLPQQKLNMYFISGQGKEVVAADFNGPWDRNTVYAINKVEESLSDGVQRTRLIVGTPDQNFVSSTASENQFSNDCGLEGVDSYGDKRDFTVSVREVSGVDRKVDEKRLFCVNISFGAKEFEATKRRMDNLFALRVLEEGAIGYVFGGWPFGAALGGAEVVDGAYGWAEGIKLNDAASFSDSRTIVGGLSGRQADAASTFGNAKNLRASDVIVVECNNPVYQGTNVVAHTPGVGVVYARGLKNVQRTENGVCFNTDSTGVNHLEALLLRGLRGATGLGIGGEKTRIINRCNGGGVTGGQTGGPGGNGSGASGGQGSGSGGNGGGN